MLYGFFFDDVVYVKFWVYGLYDVFVDVFCIGGFWLFCLFWFIYFIIDYVIEFEIEFISDFILLNMGLFFLVYVSVFLWNVFIVLL